MKIIVLILIFNVILTGNLFSKQLNKFVFTQLKYEGKWDPYPETWQDILEFITVTTSIKSETERRIVMLNDKLIFSSPLIIILGSGEFPELKTEDRSIIRKYLANGGLIYAEDSSGVRGSAFNESFRKEISKVFPEMQLTKLPLTHPLFKSYYLLKKIGGRRLTNNFLEGIELGGRTVLIYSQNDIIGSWAKDRLGNYLFECIPGGNDQRFAAHKLTQNLIMYCLTGSYKSDAIHKPYIDEKLNQSKQSN